MLSLQDTFRNVQESDSTLIKAHLVAFYASGVEMLFLYKKGLVSYKIVITVAYIPDHISCNLPPGVHASYSRIIYAILHFQTKLLTTLLAQKDELKFSERITEICRS